MVDQYEKSVYKPVAGSLKEGECFLVQCRDMDQLMEMSSELDQHFSEPNSYPAIIGAMETLDGSTCKPMCMSKDSYFFMDKSAWKDSVIISYEYYKVIFKDVDLNQLELYSTLGMES